MEESEYVELDLLLIGANAKMNDNKKYCKHVVV